MLLKNLNPTFQQISKRQVYIIILVIGFLSLLTSPRNHPAIEEQIFWFIFSLLQVLGVSFGVMILQEISHILAARLLRFEIFTSYFGARPRWVQRHLWLGNHRISLQGPPSFLFTYHGSFSLKLYRLRLALLMLARPLCVVFLAILSYSMMPTLRPPFWEVEFWNGAFSLWDWLFLAAIVRSISCLWPSSLLIKESEVFYNNGAVWQALWTKDHTPVDTLLVHTKSTFAAQLFRKDRPAEAIDYLQKALEQHPSSVNLKENLARIYFEMQDYEKALAVYQSIFEQKVELRSPKETYLEAMYCFVRISARTANHEQFYQETLPAFDAQVSDDEKNGYIFLVRCAMLIVRGSHQEGLNLLHQLRSFTLQTRTRTETEIWLAIGFARKGEFLQAEKHLSLASQLAPTIAKEHQKFISYDLRLAQQEIKRAQASPYRA
jgi:tetratricopeptide (TPR) repeat protein